MKSRMFFAAYRGNKNILVFHNQEERDTFVEQERIVHPDCHAVSEKKVKDKIKHKPITYDGSFGTLVVSL